MVRRFPFTSLAILQKIFLSQICDGTALHLGIRYLFCAVPSTCGILEGHCYHSPINFQFEVGVIDIVGTFPVALSTWTSNYFSMVILPRSVSGTGTSSC
jgi:hypothetical protein